MEILASHTGSSWIYCRSNCSGGLPISLGVSKERGNFGALSVSPAIKFLFPSVVFKDPFSTSSIHTIFHLFDSSYSGYSEVIVYCIFFFFLANLEFIKMQFTDLSTGIKGERNT